MRLRRLFKRSRPPAREERDAWLEWLELGGARPATIKGYRWTTDRLLDRYPRLHFDQFTDEHLVGIIEESNPRSRQSRRSAFANWFGWGHRTGRLKWIPMLQVPRYKQLPQQPVEVFTEAECKILCALPEPDGTLMALLLGSGLRKSEAANLSVRRVNLENGELHVVEGAKGGQSRIVPLEQKLVSRLAGYFITEGLNDDDFLWYTHPGGQKERRHHRALVGGSMHSWWVRCVEASSIPYRNLHVTRHTYATQWRRRGLHIDDVGFLLGHADLKTTHRVYVHTKIHEIRAHGGLAVTGIPENSKSHESTPSTAASTSAAKPCGTCARCGGTIYEYLTHFCSTSVRISNPGSFRLTPWGTWEWRPW